MDEQGYRKQADGQSTNKTPKHKLGILLMKDWNASQDPRTIAKTSLSLRLLEFTDIGHIC